jgi:hypothetical protein
LATYAAIAATSEAIIGLLRRARPKDEFTKAAFEVYQGDNFETPMDEGISLYLYRVTVNAARRNLPPTVGADGRRYRPPIPLDLYYLLSAWGKAFDTQHRLLGWAIRELENTPVIPSGVLNSTGPERDIFRPEETIELICDPLPLADMINLWDALKPKSSRPLSLNYVARMVAIESQVALQEYEPVQTRAFDYGKGP